MQDIAMIAVGEPLCPGVSSYNDGTIVFDIDTSGLLLRVFYKDPTAKEINAFKSGKASFSVVATENIMFFLCKFGELAWMDAPYNVHLSQPDVTLPTASFATNTGIAIMIVLVDAANGIVKALRFIGLSTGLSLRIKSLMDEQRQLPFDKDTYFTRLNHIYKRYTTTDLVKLSLTDNPTEEGQDINSR